MRFESLEERTLLATGMIDLGPSDNVALDQPRVAVEVLTPLVDDPDYYDTGDWGSVGPSIFNTLLLDTGANGVLLMATAVDDLSQAPYEYETQGVFLEAGVAGDHLMDISVPYRFDFAGTDGVRSTLFDARLLSDSENDFSIFGPWGLAGMPTMVNRVTTLDMSVWSTTAENPELFMGVDFSDDLPEDNGHRYSVAVDNRVQFDPEDQTVSGESPVWGDIPFLTAIPTSNGVGLEGNFLLDTGAQLSVISEDMAFSLGLDVSGDGSFDDEAIRFETVGGVGGTVTAPVLYLDEVRVPTEEGVDLVWTDLQWLVLDISVPGETATLDGVFGCDLLTSGWVEAYFDGAEDGYFQQVHFDFREMETNGTGAIYFDLTPAVDVVIPPGPGMRILETLGYTQVAENGSEDYLRLVLTAEPADDVTVTFAARSATTSPTDAQITVVDDESGALEITFTPSDWNIPKLLRVDAIDDAVAEGTESDWIDFTVTSVGDPDYNGLVVPAAEVEILDDDLSILVFGETDDSTIVTESGTYDTYTVALESAPSYQVWVELSNSAGQVLAYDPTQAEELNNALFFDSTNWDVPQTVRVEAIDDELEEGPHHTHVTHQIYDVHSDYSYTDLGIALFRVDIEDNDVGSVVIVESGSSTEISEEGQTDTYTIVLNEAPTDTVRIDLSTPDGQLTAVDNAQPLNTYVEFTTENWSTPQTVRVASIDDFVDEGDHAARVVHTVTSNDARFDGLTVSPVAAQIADNDTAGLQLTESDGSTRLQKGNGADTYEIVLTSQPTADVRIEFGDGNGQLHAVDNAHRNNGYIDFTPDNWDVAQTVRVAGGSGGFQHGTAEVVLTHELLSTDDNYRGTYDLIVEIVGDPLVGTTGDDVIAVVVSGTEYVITINGEATVLDAATVTSIDIDALDGNDRITIVGTDENETATVSPSSADLLGQTYEIHATSVEYVTLEAGVGSDTVTLTGSAGSNRLFSYADSTRLSDIPRTFSYQVADFETVSVDSSAGTNDYAFLYDSAENDILTATPDGTELNREDGATTRTATGFEKVYAYATAGGSDTASLTGADGARNRLYSYANYTTLTESARSFYFYARGFDSVSAHSPGSSASYAYLYDSAGDDTLEATPDSATMDRGALYSDVTATGFARVYAYATRGGDDSAALTGSASGGNRYRGYPTYSTLTDASRSFYHYARGFDSVAATGSQSDSSGDRAWLYDSSGDDTLAAAVLENGKYQGATLSDNAGTYENQILYFDLVYARSSDRNTNDVIDLDEELLAYDLLESGTW